MVSRFAIPGFSPRSKRTSRSLSVTAERIFFALTDGSSSIHSTPAVDAADLLIFDVGSCRS